LGAKIKIININYKYLFWLIGTTAKGPHPLINHFP